MQRGKLENLLNVLLKSFLQGLIIIGPVALTVWIIWYIVSSIDNILPAVSQRLYPGTTFLVVVASTALIGYIGNKFILGRLIVDSFDYLLEHTPGIKFIYTSLKDVMSSFVGDKKKFNRPVLVREAQSPEMWRVGFLTQADLSAVGFPGYVAVYLPHSYAVSGWVVFVRGQDVKLLENVSAAQAMKFAVSGGVAGFHSDEGGSRMSE